MVMNTNRLPVHHRNLSKIWSKRPRMMLQMYLITELLREIMQDAVDCIQDVVKMENHILDHNSVDILAIP
jgi:hypothetical protein